MADVDVVQGKKHTDPVGGLFSAQLDKEIVDRKDCRREKGNIGYLREIFLEEKPRTPVWENKGQTTDLRPPFLVKKRRYLI